MSWLKDKIERTEHFFRNVYKNKLETCSACSGSGYYDTTDSPACGACGGTGKEREWSSKSPENYIAYIDSDGGNSLGKHSEISAGAIKKVLFVFKALSDEEALTVFNLRIRRHDY